MSEDDEPLDFDHVLQRVQAAVGRADLPALRDFARASLREACQAVLDSCGWGVGDLKALIIDYVEPDVGRSAAEALGVDASRVTVPTETFGHVMAAGLPIALSQQEGDLAAGDRVVLAAAGPGFSWGALALEY